MQPTIGIFDSGVGGLSVAAALHRLRPSLPVHYLADTAFFPYGDREPAEIAERAVVLARGLVELGCTLLVVACNTASSAALEVLRERFSIPIVGMEPPLKPAVERSLTRRVAVLATAGTSSGARLARLRDTHGVGSDVTILSMPGLADLVEHGEVDGERIEAMLRSALEEPLAGGIDTVALGCTHYGFVRPTLARILPPGVQVIDAAEPVARRVVYLLAQAGQDPGPGGEAAELRCSATGAPEVFRASVEALQAAGADLPPLRFESSPGLPTAAAAAGEQP
jgi:glutamate racemase